MSVTFEFVGLWLLWKRVKEIVFYERYNSVWKISPMGGFRYTGNCFFQHIIKKSMIHIHCKDKLTTLDTRRHSLYHGVCGLGLTITGGNFLILRSYAIGSLTLTIGLILILLAFFNFNFAGLRVVLIRLSGKTPIFNSFNHSALSLWSFVPLLILL